MEAARLVGLQDPSALGSPCDAVAKISTHTYCELFNEHYGMATDDPCYAAAPVWVWLVIGGFALLLVVLLLGCTLTCLFGSTPVWRQSLMYGCMAVLVLVTAHNRGLGTTLVAPTHAPRAIRSLWEHRFSAYAAHL